jgi:hypothetical protein
MLGATLRMGIDAFAGRPLDAGALLATLDVDPADWAAYAATLALTSLSVGDRETARDLLQLHARNGFARVGDDGLLLTTLVLFGRATVGLDDRGTAAALYERLAPHAGLWAVDGIAGCCWGPVDMELVRLACSLDRFDDARAHLERAREIVGRAGELPLIEADLDQLARRCGQANATAARSGGSRRDDPLPASVFRREGQFWTLTYAGITTRLKDAKGLGDLARLLAAPGVEIHVLDLAGAPGARGEPVQQALASGDLGELLDARARAEYRRRLAELDDDLADAERCHDLARAERATLERDLIASELAAAVGLGGRPRRGGDPAERARKAVTGRIRLTIGRIGDDNPELARHLTNAVRTGTFCTYQPERPIEWATEPTPSAANAAAHPAGRSERI